jgi:hypothetical protein
VIHRIWSELGLRLPRLLGWFVTFNFINIAWVFFRAKNFDDAITLLSRMFTFDGVDNFHLWDEKFPIAQFIGINSDGFSLFCMFSIVMLTLGMFIVFFMPNSNILKYRFEENKKVRIMSYLLAVMTWSGALLTMSIEHGSEFLYFDF